jgi:hypothetical protein
MSGRYLGAKQYTYVTPSGARVRYLAPRILPAGASIASGAATTVEPGERHRLDLVAYRTLGNPELAYRIADANDAMDPFDLCDRPGERVLELPRSTL